MSAWALLTIWILALMAPGLDFAIVTRNTLQRGRAAGIWTSVGIFIGLWLHLLLTFVVLAGAGQTNKGIITVVMFLGGLYLLYMGVSSLWAVFSDGHRSRAELTDPKVSSLYRHPAFQGFLTNVLNPKVSLLSLSLFASYLETYSLSSMWMVFIFLSLMSGAWFVLLATIWAMEKVKRTYRRYKSYIEVVVGIGFVALAAEIFWTVGQSL